MAIFMEVRCEGLGDIDGCFSSQNAGPITSARESVKSVSIALKFLKDDSLNNGWVLHKGGLYCPVCAKAKAWDAAGIGVKQQQDSVDSDVGSRNQPGMVVAVHIDAGDFVKVKGQVFEVEETDFDDHDVTLWFVGGNALKCSAGCPVEVVSEPVAAGIKVKGE
ncbi:hypothetical protein DLR11_03185 [Salmonella enterica subsp. salamae]|uniref:Ead/Ea22-like family protein n=1 Tax=Salmonella enterica subsp. salamae TaxID=59202 RepID=A0A5Y3UYL7_SALER|nr:hypothetical protein [Salmonella enterica subsp. salamae]EDH0696513.1 hypothetical protein [Salmonella enterica]ECI3450879.1 hypothetical protein [Salmonella enterica subsp. salamae]ECJ2325317.1 hypothetical protein [Salmonella enterica subsp. salamae]EDV0904192.1 hypothetical protein [Salmonella enterica subsp. salamae]